MSEECDSFQTSAKPAPKIKNFERREWGLLPGTGVGLPGRAFPAPTTAFSMADPHCPCIVLIACIALPGPVSHFSLGPCKKGPSDLNGVIRACHPNT